MSEKTKELKWKKTSGLDEWKTKGYYIEQTSDDPCTMVAHTRTAEGLVADKVGTFKGGECGETKAAVLKRAKAACEEHRRGERPEQAAKLSVATGQPLIWHEDGEDWVASHAQDKDGPRYSCSDCGHGAYQPGYLLEPIGEPMDLESAKHACQLHADAQAAALEWKETAPNTWEATTDDGATYTCTEIGGSWRAGYSLMGLVPLWPEQVNLAGAQLLCEQHHAGRGMRWREGIRCWLADDGDERDRYACEPDDGGQWLAADQSTETDLGAGDSLDEAQALCQVHRGKRLLKAGSAERDTKPENQDNGELGDWLIPVQLTEPELAKHGQGLADLYVQLGQSTLAIAQAKETCRRTVKAAEAEIEQLNAEALPVAKMLEAGEEHRLVRCRKHKGDGELIYIALDLVTELHRHAVADGEQLGCWGNGTPPDKPPSREEAAAAAEAPGPEAAASMAKCEELAAGADPLPAGVPLTKTDFTKDEDSGAYIAGDTEGEHYRVRRTGSGLYCATFAAASGQRRELSGSHTTLKAAVTQAAADNVTRLRWPGEPKGGVLLDSTGRYQLSRYMATGPAGEMWQTQHLPGQDQPAVDLGDHLLPAAQAACQAHADELRGAGQ